jgi:sporulation protein YlmC with PRC-barrel domain
LSRRGFKFQRQSKKPKSWRFGETDRAKPGYAIGSDSEFRKGTGHMKKLAPVATAVAAVALLAAGAIAQTPPKDNPTKTMPQGQTQPSPQTAPQGQTQTTPPAGTAASASMQSTSQWRGTQLIGLDVYNNNQENIGDINDIILSSDGKIEIIVVGVGGWLGMGEHNVGLRWDQVKFVNEPIKGQTGQAVSAEEGERPDHAVVNLSKDQMKTMPAFKYAGDKTDRPSKDNAPPASKR